MLKICSNCTLKKPLNNFYTTPRRGKRVYRSVCKPCWHERQKPYIRRWQMSDKGKVFQYRQHDKRLFGGNRKIVLERDGYACVTCGMTDDEHKEKWNREITIDHIDGSGLHTPKLKKNNALSNLQTLCLPCHGKKDAKRQWSLA